MLSFILSIVLSKIGMIGLPAILLGVAVLLFINGLTRIAMVVGIVAGGWFASGIVYQEGVSACEKRVAAAVAAEQARQREAVKAVLEQADKQREVSEKEAGAMQKELDDYEAILATMARTKPDTQCLSTDDDARRLQQLLR